VPAVPDDITWSVTYRSEWDDDPEAYLRAGLVGWGKSRRLGRFADPVLGFKAYLGVHHTDPERWGRAGAAYARFFVSFIVPQGTLALHTHRTMHAVLSELHAVYERWRAASSDR
jgi:hypothetical protein